MAVGDILRITVNQMLQSAVVQNVLYYKIEIEDSSGDDLTALSAGFRNQVLDLNWRNVVSPEVTFECLALQKVFPLPISAVRDFDVSLDGLNAGESLPAMSAALIQKFNPAVGGVGKKGRVYIAGILEDQTSVGRVNVDLFSLLVILATALEANVNSVAADGEYEPVWAVRNPAAPFEITGFVEDLTFLALPRVATQRRRRTPIRAVSF